VLWAASAGAVEYNVDTAAGNRVRFVSEAPIETFEGVTKRIDGYVAWSGDSLVIGTAYGQSEVYFEVDLVALDTGIGLRNRHMRENYLHTDRYPYATYRGRIVAVERSPGDTAVVRSAGKLAIHGVERDLEIACRVTPHDSGYRIQGAFDVRLPDFKISVPSLMFLKISEVVAIDLDFYVRAVHSN
jgi:polyisoprenoid-binding protein YceI